MRRRARAFSLLELLVVIGIIALLLGILLPVLSRVRDQSNRVTCAAHLQQWGIALRAYAVANDNAFPYNGAPIPPNIPNGGLHLSRNSTVVQEFWRSYLIKNWSLEVRSRDNVLFCPLQEFHREPQRDPDGTEGLCGYFYFPARDPLNAGGMDYTAAGNGWVEKKKFGQQFRAAPIASDIIQYSSNDGTWLIGTSHTKGRLPAGANFLFEDGHVTWHDYKEIAQGATVDGWLHFYKIRL